MNSIAVICVYFGKLPSYYGVWQKSCEYNPSIDFLLFTDQIIPVHAKNIHVITMEFDDMKTLVDKAMGQHVALEFPYKMCDLRPMYGLIFEEYIQGYDYWGHCDMDMVFGDLQSFFDKYEIDKYDKFLNLGHLSIYKNTPEINQRFKCEGSRCGSWKKIISEREGHNFDEVVGIYQIYKANGFSVFDKRIYADIATVYKRFRCALKDINYDQQVYYWENGKTYRDYWVNGEKKTEEFIYIHFKRRVFEAPTFEPEMVDSFYIGPNGFSEKKGIATLETVKAINPFKGKAYERIEALLFDLRIQKKRITKKLKAGGISDGK